MGRRSPGIRAGVALSSWVSRVRARVMRGVSGLSRVTVKLGLYMLGLKQVWHFLIFQIFQINLVPKQKVE